jgi:hypothetical protein
MEEIGFGKDTWVEELLCCSNAVAYCFIAKLAVVET